MPARRKPIVSIDKTAVRGAIRDAGSRTKKAVSRKAAAKRRSARAAVEQSGRRAASRLSRKAAATRRVVEQKVTTRKDAAIRQALKTCVELSKKQLTAFKKLERSYVES